MFSKISEETEFFPPVPSVPQQTKENDAARTKAHMSCFSPQKLKGSGQVDRV